MAISFLLKKLFLGPIRAQKRVCLICRPNVKLLASGPARGDRQGCWWSQTRHSPAGHGAYMAVACWVAHAEAPD